MTDNLDLKLIIKNAQTQNKEAATALRYFNGEHDILKNRILFVNDQGVLMDDIYSSNIRIPHPFFTELVQQSTDFIFSEPVKFRAEQPLLNHLLDLYITNDTHRMLYEAVEQASIKGAEWVYAYRGEDGLVNFMTVDSQQVTEVTDEYGNTVAVVRYFDDTAQVWDKHEKRTYEKDDQGEYRLIDTVKHTLVGEDGKIEGYGRIPWFKLKNNRNETSDMKLIKAFIDDHDIMGSYASNDLQDFRGNVHVFKGGGDADVNKMKFNATNTGAVKPLGQGDYKLESHTVSIQSRIDKAEQDRENIYKVGQGFDRKSFIGNGHTTNEHLRIAQSGLTSKCKGKKVYLRMLMDWMLEMILDNIERRGLGQFALSDIDIEFTHNLYLNEKESAEIKQIEENAKKVSIDTLLSAEHILDELTMLEQVSKLLGLSVDEVKKRRAKQDYGTLTEVE